MKKQTQATDAGMVAIIVTIIMMMVISLIVITFARVARRNYRQAIDQQLHSQAFYAAESGINDAIDELKKPASPYRTTEKDDCNPLPGYNNVLDGGASSYTCLLIDPTPISLEVGNIGSGESMTLPIAREDANNIGSMTLYWQDPNENEIFTGCPAAVTSFPSSWSANCGPGIMRIDLVETGTGAVDRTTLLNRTMTSVIVPRNAGGVASVGFASAIGFGGQGTITGTRCTVPNTTTKPKHCSVTITGMNNPKYYLRMTALYKAATVTVCMPACGSASTQPFALGTQAKIDSTGKISDVLRRIQVHVSTAIELEGLFPTHAIQSGETICKRFSFAPPDVVDGDTAVSASCAAP